MPATMANAMRFTTTELAELETKIANAADRALTIEQGVFDRLVAEAEPFRKFVFDAYSRRLIDMLRVVDDVAFGRIDVRLAERLLALAGDMKEIAATHQDLASELGTAREVISRVLADFQKRGLVQQSRGRIALVDKSALRALAESA